MVIAEYNDSNKVYFQFNDTTTYSKTNKIQSTPSYISPDLSISTIALAVGKNEPAYIYGITNSTLQITNYGPITVTDYQIINILFINVIIKMEKN